MKITRKIICVILAIVTMLSTYMLLPLKELLPSVSAFSQYSSQRSANNNSAETGPIHIGDTVTYTASLKYGNDKTDKLAAINATVTYDADVLEIKSDFETISFPF